MTRFFTFIDNLPKSAYIILSFLLLALIGFIDYITGYEISISIFYTIPVSLVAWSLGRWAAVGVSLLSVLVWIGGDIAMGLTLGSPVILAWNTLSSFFILVIYSYFLSLIKHLYEKEKFSARYDPLTGISNRKNFFDVVSGEIKRAARYRYSVTVAYVDVDNFKKVNDTLGHDAGDALLVSIAGALRDNIRSFDLAARFGGDEFVLFMPSTDGPQAAQAVDKLRDVINELIARNGWPISLSIGVLTCYSPHLPLEELIKRADDLMYKVKTSGKNRVHYAELKEE